MSGKFMRVKRIVIPTLTMIVIASQLIGCSSTSKSETSSMLDSNSSGIEVEVAVPDGESEEDTVTLLNWSPLSQLVDYNEFRTLMDEKFGVVNEAGSKNGCIYIDLEGHHSGNNTLFNALHNKKFRETITNEDVEDALMMNIDVQFTDLEDSDKMAAIYNTYFNLLPSESTTDVVVVDESSSTAELKEETDTSTFNGSSTLTRSQAMALVMRASTPVTASGEPENYTSFTDKVGYTSYTPFASYEDKNVYLSTETGLDQTTVEGSMTRGEYIYLVMSSIYGADEISKVDTTKSKLTDCTELKDTTGTNAEIIANALKSPDKGAPTEIFKALVKANTLGAIDPETRWDEAITKTEAIDIYVNSVYKYAEDKQIQIEKEEAAKLKAQYTEEAKKFYKEDKSDKERPISCTEDEYVKHYIGVRPTMTADEAHEETHDFFAHAHAEKENAKKQEEERKKKEEEEKKQQQEQQNNDNGNNGNNNNNNNGGGNDYTYTEPEPEPYTPPSDNGGGDNGGGNNNGGGGNQDTYTPPSDNGGGGGNDQVDPGGVPDPSADGWDDVDPGGVF